MMVVHPGAELGSSGGKELEPHPMLVGTLGFAFPAIEGRMGWIDLRTDREQRVDCSSGKFFGLGSVGRGGPSDMHEMTFAS